jgi:RNA polymerase sigma factor (sigma-70 family)
MKQKVPEMTALEEQDTAIHILALEEELRELLREVPACRRLLDTGRGATRHTRHASVELLNRASELARHERAEPTLLAHAVVAQDAAQALRWRLALSGGRVARSEARRSFSQRISIDDLEQEGVIGLLGAAERYEPGGIRFAAYARWWVRAQITAAIQHASTFQISAAVFELHRNARKLLQRDDQAGVSRTAAQLSASLGVKQRRLDNVMAIGDLRAIDDDPNVTALANLPDLITRSPEALLAEADASRWVRAQLLQGFDPRDRHILASRHGLDTEVMSFAEIAKGLSLSAERVRQLEQQGIAALRELFAREMDV